MTPDRFARPALRGVPSAVRANLETAQRRETIRKRSCGRCSSKNRTPDKILDLVWIGFESVQGFGRPFIKPQLEEWPHLGFVPVGKNSFLEQSVIDVAKGFHQVMSHWFASWPMIGSKVAYIEMRLRASFKEASFQQVKASFLNPAELSSQRCLLDHPVLEASP